jgi:hypothetical protein
MATRPARAGDVWDEDRALCFILAGPEIVPENREAVAQGVTSGPSRFSGSVVLTAKRVFRTPLPNGGGGASYRRGRPSSLRGWAPFLV